MASGTTSTSISASTAAVTNRFVASTNMKVGAYTVANASPAWNGACFVTVTHTTVVTTDTLGTVVVVGTDLAGNARTETLTPVADSTVTGSVPFRTVTSVTGAGWVIAGSNDTLVVGCAAGSIVCGSSGTLYSVLVNVTAAATVVLSDAKGTIQTFPVSAAVGNYVFGPGIDFASYLKVATTSTNDVLVVTSATNPAGA